LAEVYRSVVILVICVIGRRGLTQSDKGTRDLRL